MAVRQTQTIPRQANQRPMNRTMIYHNRIMEKEIMKMPTIVVVFLGLTFALSPPVQAQTTNAQETLNQYVTSLQAKP